MAAVVVVIAGVGLVAALSDTSRGSHPARDTAIALSLMSGVGFAATFKLRQMAAEIDEELATTLVERIVALLLLAARLVWRRPAVWPGWRV